VISLIINCAGVALGTAGTLLNVSVNHRVKHLAFKLWLVSDVFLSAWALLTGNYPLLFLYSLYAVIAVASILNNRKTLVK
jgi:hypothetical protein